MNKNIIKMLILVALFAVISFNMTVFATFEDIDNHWAEDTINKFIENDYIDNENNNFKPDSELSKGEMATMINRYFAYGSIASQEDNLKLAEEKGYLFNAQKDDCITREEIAVIMCKVLSFEPSENTNKSFIDDNKFSVWAKGYVYTLADKEIIVGYPDMEYKPQKNITKAEFVTLLNRCIGSGGASLEIVESEVNNIQIGIFAYDEEQISIIPIEDIVTMSSGDKLDLAITIPEGIEEEGISLNIEGCDVVDLEEDCYRLIALKQGEARVFCKSLKGDYVFEFKVIVE